MLTPSVKGSQAFGSSTCQRKQETQAVAAPPLPPLPPPAHTSVNAQPVPVQNGKHQLAVVDWIIFLVRLLVAIKIILHNIYKNKAMHIISFKTAVIR